MVYSASMPLLSLLILSLGWQGPSSDSAQEEVAKLSKPNIILIMVDDMGWADLSAYGGKVVQTPRLDRLAEEGMVFTQAYSGCTVCAPARSTLMDGRHMGHTSVRLNTGGVPLRAEDFTLAEALRKAGYQVGGFGKWGLGELGTEGAPEKQGFDEFFGYYHQIHAHYHLPDYLIRNGEKVPLPGNRDFYTQYPHMRYSGPFPLVDPETQLRRQFAPEIIYQETLAFLRRAAAKERPFFCYAAWTPPHGEYLIPEEFREWPLYAEKKNWPVRAKVVAAYLSMVDRHVGGVLDLLDQLELREETLVFFLSDHGADLDYDGSLDSCGPLRGKKRTLYEGGLRVPMLVSWPGVIESGRRSDHLCYFPDFFPTFLELAQAPIPERLDGISFLATLRAQGEQRQHPHLYWEWARYDWGKKQLVENGLMQAVRMGPWKGISLHPQEPFQLFHLERDPGERQNLAADHPDLVRRLREIMKDSHRPMRAQQEPPRLEGKAFR
ncbi:MAG: hypothetical protein DWQ01_18070 [Planctomycetota bacterium]|nr:MAG: hypothetical protein DWQ01_18070 [Planctomycetota bacterium]